MKTYHTTKILENNKKEIVVFVKVKHSDVKYIFVKGFATKYLNSLWKSLKYKRVTSYGLCGTKEIDGQIFYGYKFVVVV